MSAEILRFPPRSAPRSVGELVDSIDAGLERMIRAQMEAYPSHWTEAERREMAERHLLGGGPEAA